MKPPRTEAGKDEGIGGEDRSERSSAATTRLACVPVTPRPTQPDVPEWLERTTPPPGRTTPVPDRLSLRLVKLRPGHERTLRLELVAGEPEREIGTGCSLEIRISCDADQHVFWLDVKPDFAGCVPRSAAVTLLQDGGASTESFEVVDGRRLRERCIPLALAADTRRLRFRVITEGAPELPPQMSAEVRLRTSTLPPAGA